MEEDLEAEAESEGASFLTPRLYTPNNSKPNFASPPSPVPYDSPPVDEEEEEEEEEDREQSPILKRAESIIEDLEGRRVSSAHDSRVAARKKDTGEFATQEVVM